MSILQALNRAYNRLATENKVAPFGFSNEKISFCISLNSDGSMAGQPIDLRISEKSKMLPRMMELPQPTKRTVGIASNFLWDKSSYTLGITEALVKAKIALDNEPENTVLLAAFEKIKKRLGDEHQAFVDYHKQLFKDTNDEGLKAFLTFQENWKPEEFENVDWPENIKKDILDANICFALESERLNHIYLHTRQKASEIWANLSVANAKDAEICLVSGQKAPLQRLHPSIKGVWGGQSAGASIVSFNLDAFTSYGHEQGANAPVSEAAAFAYTTVLNKFLAKGSKNRIQIGDASTVFWADCDDTKLAQTAEQAFTILMDEEPIDLDKEAEFEIRPILEKIHKGEKVSDFAPGLSEGVKFYVLGLSPNAARISIRFWYEGTFGQLADNYQKFQQEMAIEPKERAPFALWKYLCETAVLNKRDNIAPNLAGNWMQSILFGTRYPQTLFTSVLTRIRADHDINARRVAILKSLLIRNFNSKEAKVAFDHENRNKGYLLGRLFAIYERIQESAIKNANATIRDKFYGAASAQPRKIFGMLSSGSMNHLSKIRKENKGREIYFNNLVAGVLELISPENDPYPISFSPEEQALFSLGYYHQRNEFFKSKSTETQDTHEEA